jgi:anti-sigma factor RsiW
MRCHDARALATPWSDSELDAKTSFEIQRHLDDCPGCRAYFEGGRRADAWIDSVLRSGGRDEELWSRIEAGLAPPERVARRSAAGWRAAFAVAAVLALAGLSLRAIQEWRPRTMDLAAAAALDHAKHLAGDMPAQFAGPPPPELLERAEGRLDRDAFSLLPPGDAYRVEGGRVCFLKGVPVAWLLGRARGAPVSFIVMRREETGRFPDLQDRFDQGHEIACSEAGGFQFAARTVGDHVVCAVAGLPRKELETLVAMVLPPDR